MSIQEELELNIKKMNEKLSSNKDLDVEDMKTLLLSTLIEEEAKQ